MIEKKKERIRESNIYVKTPFLKYSAITINLESILGNLNLFNWQFIGNILVLYILLSFIYILFIFYLELYKNNNPTAAFIYYLYILNGSLFKSNIYNESFYIYRFFRPDFIKKNRPSFQILFYIIYFLDHFQKQIIVIQPNLFLLKCLQLRVSMLKHFAWLVISYLCMPDSQSKPYLYTPDQLYSCQIPVANQKIGYILKNNF